MIAIVDYDAGNVRSVEKAFAKLGRKTVISRDPSEILKADHVVLPGVGNFGDAMTNLKKYGMDSVIMEVAERGIPFLGICVGMQMLFAGSEESPDVPGLGILKGYCRRFKDRPGFKIPQIGWNSIHLMNGGDLFDGIPGGSFVYFVHSYYCEAEDLSVVKAVSEYTGVFHAAVQKGKICATQFHPEKSGDTGLQILKNFCRMA
ncbi:MAG: imidazole glycerol phosphate synthase subunit HisH [Lachnospiraceae bacterium]|nr:imidazole glycerol phosphate synthase subunit HisH [Lachnospiraceae bacterium]